MLPEPSQSGSCYWSTPGLPKGHPYNFCWTRGFLDGRGPSLFRLLEPLERDNRPCPPRMPHLCRPPGKSGLQIQGPRTTFGHGKSSIFTGGLLDAGRTTCMDNCGQTVQMISSGSHIFKLCICCSVFLMTMCQVRHIRILLCNL
ncbi:uncharacterized protein LOC144103899 isoform X2 [Amblyomma americanum]